MPCSTDPMWATHLYQLRGEFCVTHVRSVQNSQKQALSQNGGTPKNVSHKEHKHPHGNPRCLSDYEGGRMSLQNKIKVHCMHCCHVDHISKVDNIHGLML